MVASGRFRVTANHLTRVGHIDRRRLTAFGVSSDARKGALEWTRRERDLRSSQPLLRVVPFEFVPGVRRGLNGYA